MYGADISRGGRPPSRRSILQGALGAFGVAAGGGLLAACGSSPSSSSVVSSGGGKTSDVTFLAILPMTSLTFTPEYVASAGGIYKKHGLNVTFQTTHGSAPAFQAILAGRGFITRVGDDEIMKAALVNKAPVVNVGTNQNYVPIRIASSKDKPLKSPQDLKDKTIGMPSAGGTSATLVNLLLATQGIPQKSVNEQVVGGFSPSSFSLITSGKLDGYVVSSDTAVILQEQQPNAYIFDFSSFLNAGAQDYMTTKSVIDSQPDTLRRYMQATKEAMQFVVDDAPGFNKTLDLLKSPQFQITAVKTPDIVRQVLPHYISSWTRHGQGQLLETDATRWKNAYSQMVSTGVLPAGGDPSAWFTNTFVSG